MLQIRLVDWLVRCAFGGCLFNRLVGSVLVVGRNETNRFLRSLRSVEMTERRAAQKTREKKAFLALVPAGTSAAGMFQEHQAASAGRFGNQTVYVEADVAPPWPVQFVSTRS